MPKATITLQDTENGEVNVLFHFEHGFNDESRAHIMANLLSRHLNVIGEQKTKERPVELIDVDGHLELAPPANDTATGPEPRAA